MNLSPLPKPYKTGFEHGIHIVKQLLKHEIKVVIDLMASNPGSYMMNYFDEDWYLTIPKTASIKIAKSHVNTLLELLIDGAKTENNATFYYLLPERYKQILTYYQ